MAWIPAEEPYVWIHDKLAEVVRRANRRYGFDLIHGRISSLGEEEREILDVASCCGFEFDPLLVGRVLGVADIPLLLEGGGPAAYGLEELPELERQYLDELMSEPDAEEGIRAFLEKRPPRWQGGGTDT